MLLGQVFFHSFRLGIFPYELVLTQSSEEAVCKQLFYRTDCGASTAERTQKLDFSHDQRY